MKATALFCLLVLLAFAVSLAGNRGHHGKPTPTPSPTVSPTVTPNPTPSPSPSPIPILTLAWDPSVGAAGYHLWLGFASGAETQATNVANATAWTLQLQSGTTYYFVVTAYNSAGESAPSNEVSYTTPP